MLAMLRGGTAALRIETGRWNELTVFNPSRIRSSGLMNDLTHFNP